MKDTFEKECGCASHLWHDKVQLLEEEIIRLTVESADLQAERAADRDLMTRLQTAYEKHRDANVKLREALTGMVALWERVHENHGPVLLGKPTLNAAHQALKEAE